MLMYDGSERCLNTVLVERGIAACAAAADAGAEPLPIELPSDSSEWDVFVCSVLSACDVTVRIVGDRYSVRHDRFAASLRLCTAMCNYVISAKPN